MEEFLSEYGMILPVIVFLGFLVSYCLYIDPERVYRRELALRGKQMQDARRAYLLSRVADWVTDGSDNDYLNNQISWKERRELCTMVGNKLGIKDLWPNHGKLAQTFLKKEIKHRLDSDKYYGTPVIFPDCPRWVIRFQANQPKHIYPLS